MNVLPSAQPSLIDYIITYRGSSADRKAALRFVVKTLQDMFVELNIVIVEQDNEPQLVPSQWPGCEIIFVHNNGLFNRGWANNVGARHSKRPFIVFADCDVFMVKQDYLQAFGALNQFEAVDPKCHFLTNIVLPASIEAVAKIKNKRYGNTFAGAIFMIRREALLKVGYWDEKFEGWGGEDNVMAHVIWLILSHCRLQLTVFHIDHSRSIFDTKAQPNYQANFNRSQQICAEHGSAIFEYIANKTAQPIGVADKYREPLLI